MHQVIALYDYSDPSEPTALPFNAGDIIHVISQLESGWFDGICNGQRGWFPSNYVQERKLSRLPISPTTINSSNNNIYNNSDSNNNSATLINTSIAQHQQSKQLLVSAQSTNSNTTIEKSNALHQSATTTTTTTTTTSTAASASSSSIPINHQLASLSLESKTQKNDPIFTSLKPFLPSLNVHHLETQSKNQQLHPQWSKKESKEGRPYYYNMKSDLTTWNKSDIDATTGDLMVPKSPSHVISINGPSTPGTPADRLFEAQNQANGWSSCSTLIQNSIITMNDVVKVQNGTKVITYASIIVDNIRHMFYSSNTAQVDSIYLESNTILKSYHKQITNSLSKLVMCAKAASALNASRETFTSLSQSATELLMAIKYFIPIAVSSGVPFNSENAPIDTLTSQMNQDNSSMKQIQQISLSIERCFIQSQQLLNALDTELFSTNIINRVRYFVTEIGSFLTLVDDAQSSDEESNGETDPLLQSAFKSTKLSLYNQVSSLVMETQLATQSHSPMTNMLEIARFCRIVIIGMQTVFDQLNTILFSQDKIPEMTVFTPKPVFEKEKRSISMVQYSGQSIIPIEVQPKSAPVGQKESLENSDIEANLIQKKASKEKVLRKKFGEVPNLRSVDMTSPKLPPKDQPLRIKEWSKDFDQNDLEFDMDGNLKSATLEVLIERLVSSDEIQVEYQRYFLMMYKSFMPSQNLFDLLVKRYEMEAPMKMSLSDQLQWAEQKQKTVKQKMWVELYMQNEIGDFQVMSLIRTFSELFISQDFPHISDQLIMLVDKRIVSPDQFNRRSINTRQTPPCLLAKNVNFKKVKLVDMDCLEVARQLTLMDFELFIKIQPTEFIQQAWSLKSTNNANQNINKMIQFSNRITQWVSVTLLLEKDLKKRGNLLKFFINLADKLKTLNSLNSLMAIIKALNCPGVHRLNRTWSQLPTKSIVILDALKRMMDPTKHLLNYKEYLRTMQNSSCVPFLGFYLSELTGIQDAYSDTIMSSKGKVMIHFDKRVKIGQVIHGIQNYQSVPFAIYMHDEMAEWLDTLMQVEGCDLMSQSLILEPKEREDDKISRLLLESGFL